MGDSTTARAGTTKIAVVGELHPRRAIRRQQGVAEGTGGQAHSVRGANFSALKQKLGPVMTSEKIDRRRVDQIVPGGEGVRSSRSMDTSHVG